jgi:hypothetical protein
MRKIITVFALAIAVIVSLFVLFSSGSVGMQSGTAGVIAIIVAVISAVLVAALVMRNERGEPRKDERTMIIEGKAMTYSWWTTFLALIAIFWSDYLGFATLDIQTSASILFWTMMGSLLLFKYVFGSEKN